MGQVEGRGVDFGGERNYTGLCGGCLDVVHAVASWLSEESRREYRSPSAWTIFLLRRIIFRAIYNLLVKGMDRFEIHPLQVRNFLIQYNYSSSLLVFNNWTSNDE